MHEGRPRSRAPAACSAAPGSPAGSPRSPTRPAGIPARPTTSSAPRRARSSARSIASGVPPWFMVAHSAGETFDGVVDADGRPAAAASRSGGADFKLHRGLPPIGPGSWRLGLAAMRNPLLYTPATVMGAWLPIGLISNDPIKDIVRRVVPEGWTDHPNTWIVASDYRSGRRVAVRPRGRARGRPGRRGRRLVRDPRLLPRRSTSPAAATSTAACTRRRTSTCWPARGSTWSSA